MADPKGFEPLTFWSVAVKKFFLTLQKFNKIKGFRVVSSCFRY